MSTTNTYAECGLFSKKKSHKFRKINIVPTRIDRYISRKVGYEHFSALQYKELSKPEFYNLIEKIIIYLGNRYSVYAYLITF